MTPPKMPMVVEYVRTYSDKDRIFQYIKPIGVRFCCPDMSQHYRRGVIEFGNRKAETTFNKSADVFLRVEGGAQIFRSPTDEQYQNGVRQVLVKPNTDIALPYCPWCREPVMTLEVSLDTTILGIELP